MFFFSLRKSRLHCCRYGFVILLYNPKSKKKPHTPESPIKLHIKIWPFSALPNTQPANIEISLCICGFLWISIGLREQNILGRFPFVGRTLPYNEEKIFFHSNTQTHSFAVYLSCVFMYDQPVMYARARAPQWMHQTKRFRRRSIYSFKRPACPFIFLCRCCCCCCRLFRSLLIDLIALFIIAKKRPLSPPPLSPQSSPSCHCRISGNAECLFYAETILLEVGYSLEKL